jgi:hypothetical protein
MRKKFQRPGAMQEGREVRTRYTVGAHVVETLGQSGRWAVIVDGARLDASFACSADAWTAGIAEAERLDGTRG